MNFSIFEFEIQNHGEMKNNLVALNGKKDGNFKINDLLHVVH
jgi:hypothetical protein